MTNSIIATTGVLDWNSSAQYRPATGSQGTALGAFWTATVAENTPQEALILDKTRLVDRRVKLDLSLTRPRLAS